MTPRELRHSFVSLLSDSGVPIESIAQLVGHTSSRTTEVVYRHQIRPVIQTAAQAMDELFPTGLGALPDPQECIERSLPISLRLSTFSDPGLEHGQQG